VRNLLRRATRDPNRLAALAANLGSRPELAGLLLETGGAGLLIESHRGLLFDLARDALLADDRRLVLALLRDPRSVEKTAEGLADLTWPAGLRLLADVVIGRVGLPPAARARLAGARPNPSFYRERPLTEDRVADLLETAREDEDHAIRLLAARVLLRSGDPEVFPAVVEAYASCRSVEMERWEWRRIGSWFHRRVFDADVPAAAKLSVLRGSVQFGQVFAGDDPEAAERVALDFRRLYEEASDRRLRGELLRETDWLHVHLVDEGGRRKRAVPTWRKFLEELVAGREDDPPEVAALGRRIAEGLLADLEREPAPRYRRMDVPLPRRPDRGESVETSFRWDPEWEAPARPTPDDALPDLMRRVLGSADPFDAWRAAAALDRSNSPEAYRTLLRAAGRLWAHEYGDTPSVPSAAVHATAMEGVEVLLRFLEDRQASPHVRLTAFETLSSGMPVETLRRVDRWVGEGAPLLDGGLPEAILLSWDATVVAAKEEEQVDEAEPIGWKTVLAAIERVPAGGPRLRLRAWAESTREWR
jgi:hypothetical protein